MTVWVSEYQSEHFRFLAVGEAREAAIEALREGLRAHAGHYGLQGTWWFDDDLDAYEVPVGGATRDGTVIGYDARP